MSKTSPTWLRWGTRFVNWSRLLGMHSHQRKLDQARQVIRRIRELEGDALSARCIGYLRAIDPFVFEEVVLSCLEEGGAAVLRNVRYTGDGGIDGRVFSANAGTWAAVQAKRWRHHVCREDVLAFQALLERRRFARGLFVHTGRTGIDLRASLRDSRVVFCSGESLAQLVRHAVLPL